MNILLVGSGGREHALAWKISRSPLVERLVIAPGNPGMESLGELKPVRADDADGLAALAREIRADLVVVGPESALEAGLADRLAAAGVPCFGPTRKAARLETSKAFSKAFCERHNIPTAGYGVYETVAEARAALDRFSPPYVIKADGLAAGKGVAISPDRRDAEAEIERMLGGRFGEAGARVVIEEFMDGEEGSLFALCDGTRAVLLGGAQDHKRAFDGDLGPNTGGMGAYSPAPVFDKALVQAAQQTIVEPVLAGMAAEGAPYRGVLYAGLMATAEGPKVVEFNARFGDPECQVLMLRLKSDLVPYLLACARGDDHAERGPRIPFGTAVGEATVERVLDEVDEVGLQAQHDRLRLGIAEARVELDHLRRAVGTDHQSCVEEADERCAFGSHARNGRADDLVEDAPFDRRGDHRRG